MTQRRTQRGVRLLALITSFGAIALAGGAAYDAPAGATYEHVYPGPNYVGPTDEVGYTAIEQIQTPRLLPQDMYISTVFGFKGTQSGGYAGIQTHGVLADGSRGDMAIFSVWDAITAIPGPGSACVRFGGEGVGWSCRARLAVVPGHQYKVSIAADHAEGTNQWWHASITDLTAGKTVDLGLIEANTTQPATVSSGFLEYFGDTRRLACDQYPYAVGEFSNPLLTPADGSPAAPATLRVPPAAATCANGTMTETADGVRVDFGGPKPTAVSNLNGRLHNGSGTISWTNPMSNGGSPILRTVIETSTDGGATFPTTTVVPAGRTSFPLRGLDPRTNALRVAAVNAGGTGAYSEVGLLPSAPRLLKVVHGSGRAKVTFTPPADPTAGSVTGYVITPYINGVARAPRVFNGTATTQTVTNLANKKSYAFTVAAINALGTGPESNRSRVVKIGVPAAPAGLRVTKTAGHTLKVSFTPGASNGSPIMKYSVVSKSTNGGARKTTNGTSSPITVTGLTAGKSYTVTVTATNARGNGPTSSPAPIVIP